MALKPEQVDQLLKMIEQTRDVELTCPECLDELDRYVQRLRDGLPIDGVLERVREHLEACPFCNDECKLVLDTLKAIDEA
jgi:hypothetical protein